MPLSPRDAEAQAKDLLDLRDNELGRLDKIRAYLRDDPNTRLPGLPSGAPKEVHDLARVSRVNMLKFIVNARVQAMYVDGFRTPQSADDVPAWKVWRRNRMKARQIGLHRAAVSYGASYLTVLPGDPIPVMRGASPRNLTPAYGDDDDWPLYALEKRRNGWWRLLDDTSVYWLRKPEESTEKFEHRRTEDHGVTFDGEPVTPVVRYRETEDLDDPVAGIVEPHLALQEQINITTFGLQVAQHYGAFRQRAIIGWIAETEQERLRASASKLWTFEDHPDDIKIQEFSETNLSGYIESREATLRHLATVSQTPAHELLGQLVNLSADALAAANDSHYRAVSENQTVLGESHETSLHLAGELLGEKVDPSAYVRWRDTEARAFGMVVDALGKLAKMLGVPPQELWEMVPDVSQDQVNRWKAAAEEGNALGQLNAIIERQMGGGQETEPAPEPETV